MKGPQLQEKDLVLVKIVAHKEDTSYKINGNQRNM